MPTLKATDILKKGTTAVDKAYYGTTLVWQKSVPVTVSLTISKTQINTGESVTLTATLSQPLATGTVEFRSGSPTGTIVATDTASPWTATINPTTDTTYYAVYKGNAPFLPGNSNSVFVDVAGVTNLSLSADRTTVAQGQTVTLTASIPGVTAGTVNFRSGSGTGPILSTDTASPWQYTFTPTGDITIYAEYPATVEQMAAVSAPVSINFYIPTSTTISADKSTVNNGEAVTLTAVVAGVSAGTVNFRAGSPTGAIVATDTSAPWSVAVTPSADTTYYAEYLGSGDYAASNSGGVFVNFQIPTSISISASAGAVNPGGVINLSASVSHPGPGYVNWYWSSNGGASWNLFAQPAYPYNTSIQPGSDCHIYAEFIGGGDYVPSGSNAPWIDYQIPTSTSLGQSTGTINNGQSLTLQAYVSGGANYVVSFYNHNWALIAQANAPYVIGVAPTADTNYIAYYEANGDYLQSGSGWVGVHVRQVTAKRWTGNSTWSASYAGDNSKRSPEELYYGYYSSTWGHQKSLVGFAIPDLSGCIEVTSAKFQFYNKHHYLNSGGNIYIALHDYASEPSTWSDGRVDKEEQTVGDAPKPGTVSLSLDASIRGKLKTAGVKGFGFGPAPSNSQSYYGYASDASSNLFCEINYTVWE